MRCRGRIFVRRRGTVGEINFRQVKSRVSKVSKELMSHTPKLKGEITEDIWSQSLTRRFIQGRKKMLWLGCDDVQIWQLLVSRLSGKFMELLLQFGWMSKNLVDIFFAVYAVHYLP